MELLSGRTFKERARSLMKCSSRGDCTFLVGSEDKEEIKGITFLLSLASPVFDAMFYGSVPQEQPVEITDVEPKIFHRLLEFAYSRTLEFESREEAALLCRVADKYLMNDLLELCSSYLKSESYDDMWLNLECISNYNIPSLYPSTLLSIRDNIFRMLDDLKFEQLSPFALRFLLELEYFTPPGELQIFNAVLRWANRKCVEKDFEPTPENMRDMLLKHNMIISFRFLRMTAEDFALGPAKSGVLLVREVNAVFMAMALNDTSELEHTSFGLSILKSRQVMRNIEERQSNNMVKDEETDEDGYLPQRADDTDVDDFSDMSDPEMDSNNGDRDEDNGGIGEVYEEMFDEADSSDSTM